VTTDVSSGWSSAAGVGPEVAAALRPHVGAIADAVLAAVVVEVPPFTEWLEGSRNLREGVEQGLAGFLELLESGDEGLLPRREVYFDFGRGELRAGRSIDAVLTAYRVAAQATWRSMARAGHAGGLDPRDLYVVAERLFAYMDRMSAATAEGFAYERAVRAGERRDRRKRLVELLLRQPACARAELERDAGAVGWRVPPALAVLAFPDERVTRMAARLPADTLVARVGTMGYAVLPDPDAPGRRAAITRGLGAVRCALGPTVAPDGAGASARLARLALALPGGEPGLVLADARRVDLLLAQDEAIADGLVAGALGPLDALPAAQRVRLEETLDAWLRHQGEVRVAAAELHVHAQTVRYRLGRLRDLLGARIATADGRLELELALRARRLCAAREGARVSR
jgi:PucR C-terminal helix-turn-helix domain